MRRITMLGNEQNLLAVFGTYLDAVMKHTLVTRIMRADYFLQMIQSERNYLPRVLKWQDVYECYVVRLKIHNCKVRHLLRNFYGQCWSFRKSESELLWNARDANVGKNKHDVVMIESSVYDLVKSIQDIEFVPGHAQGVVRVASVDYNLCEKISEGQIALDLSSDANMMDTLFMKRAQFGDEKELRLMFNIHGRLFHKYLDYKIDKGILSYPLKNKTLIRSVLCHPLMGKQRVRQIERAINKSSWRIPNVRQSDLYDLPKTEFHMFD